MPSTPHASHQRHVLRRLGRLGDAPGEFRGPTGILIAQGLLFEFVAEARCVQVLALDGTPRQVLVVPGAYSLGHMACDGTNV